MEIDFEAYRIFCIVAECESFSKAAEKLYISQPAITQTIKKLEENLRGKLFFRNPKGVKLTDEGMHLYKYIKTSVDIMNNAKNKFSQFINLEEGNIKVKTGSALGNIGIYDAIIEFSKKYPKIKVEVSGGYINDSMDLLTKGEVDLVAVNLPFEYDEANIQIIECGKIEDCFYATKEYYNSINSKKQIKELLKTELIAPSEKSTTGKILKQFCEKNDIKYEPKFVMTSTNARKYFTMQGLGIGFGIKENIKEELESGKAIEIKVSSKPLVRSFGIAVQKKELLNNATLKLIDIIKNR